MTTFHLTVVTPDGCAFEGQAERVVCRAIDGDLAILAKHGDYCTALGMGEAHIVDAEGSRRRAACMGGMLTVLDGEVRLVAILHYLSHHYIYIQLHLKIAHFQYIFYPNI